MPDGAPVKRLDVSRLNKLGWKSSTELTDGLRKTYQWFLQNISANELHQFGKSL